MISAKIIADSLNTHGQRLTTFVLVFPRIVLAEFNTHRMISRNSASSRAIPFHKMLEMVQNNPFMPIKWMKDHPGMQGTEYFNDIEGGSKYTAAFIENLWQDAKEAAIEKAIALNAAGLSKQFVNRVLEPYMWHTVIATGTEWENFFSLRAHPDAEMHIQELAHIMLETYNQATPKQLEPGQWHIPFGDKFDAERIKEVSSFAYANHPEPWLTDEQIKIKLATARCARISYNTFEGKDDYVADIKLHDRLASSGHWSPFEHCAQAMTVDQMEQWEVRTPQRDAEGLPRAFFVQDESGVCGNFKGFIQYRKLFKDENRKDPRVTKVWLNEHAADTQHGPKAAGHI